MARAALKQWAKKVESDKWLGLKFVRLEKTEDNIQHLLNLLEGGSVDQEFSELILVDLNR